MKFTFFSTDFSKNIRISHFIKIQPVGAEFHAKGMTDTHDEGKWSIFANFPTCLKMLHDKPSTLISELQFMLELQKHQSSSTNA